MLRDHPAQGLSTEIAAPSLAISAGILPGMFPQDLSVPLGPAWVGPWSPSGGEPCAGQCSGLTLAVVKETEVQGGEVMPPVSHGSSV